MPIFEHLVCPRDHSRLDERGDRLECEHSHGFPVVDGIPVFLLDELADNSMIEQAVALAARPEPDIYNGQAVHPRVQGLVAATNGRLYRHLVGKMDRYPIPDIRLPSGKGKLLLDVGCNWGRWCVAAARKGYTVVGIDPDLYSLRAAKTVAAQCGVEAAFVCGDARAMPFKAGTFDNAFSYSVIQHFSKPHARLIIAEIGRVLKAGGESFVQMANKHSLLATLHRARRGFSEGKAFEVRYWSPREMINAFEEGVGAAELSVDGFLGLGIQPSDVDLMPLKYKIVVGVSEALRKSGVAPMLAESLYVTSHKAAAPLQ